MSNAPPGWKLCQIARRTLSRDDHDPRPIPYHYLQILQNHLEANPEEDNFLMDLDDGGGIVTCLDCWSEVPVANLQGELKGFEAFWAHISTAAHQNLASKRLKGFRAKPPKQEPIDVDMESSDGVLPMAGHAATTSQDNLSLPTAKVRRRVRKTVYFPDGEEFQYSTDEDEQPINMLQTPSTSSGYSSPPDTSSKHVSPYHPPNSSVSLPPSSSHGTAYTAPPQNRLSTPVASGAYSTFYDGASDYNASPYTAGPSNYTSRSLDVTHPTKRPRRGVRRHDFGNGEVFYLSTDDEDVDESSGAFPEKKPRLGGALIKNQHGIVKTEYPMMQDQRSLIKSEYPTFRNEHFPVQSQSPAVMVEPSENYHNAGGSSSVAPRAMDMHYPSAHNLVHQGASGSGIHNPYEPEPAWGEDQANWPQEEQGWDQEMQYYDDILADSHELAMPGGFEPVDGMGYHTPQVPPNYEVPNGYAAGYDERPHAGNFNLNYDEGGPMGRVDVGGPDQLEKLKDFFASVMEDLQEAPKVVDAARALGLPDPTALLPGLEVQLMPHQLIGVSWMVAQEASIIRGGILADDMGLGKTVQCIAMCAKNLPRDEVDGRKVTLIVAPAALLEQWAAEFRERAVEGLFRVHIHHGPNKLRSADQVKQYDFIITTYQTLCMDFPKDNKGKGKATPSAPDFEDEDLSQWGPLAATEWYRVVLDEAQCIRNRATRSSRCVARLNSTYKWVLTGTPVTNSLVDLYALMRFLQFRPFNDWKEFNDRIGKVQKKRPDIAGKRAQTVLKKCLLRRTKHTTLEDGKLILQLPPKSVEVIEVEFSPEEREIYQKIEEQQRQRMSKFLKAGTVMKNYAVILVMLLRLRQVCNHPQLITAEDFDEGGHRVIEEDSEVDGDGQLHKKVDTSPAAELKRAETLLGPQFIQEAKSKLLEQAKVRILAEIHGTEVEEEDCPICFDTYVNNCHITSCKHLFCGDCLNDVFKNKPNGVDDAAYAEGLNDGSRSCPVCRGRIYPHRIFKAAAFEPSASELDAIRAKVTGLNPREIIDLTLDDDDEGSTSSHDPDGKGKAAVKNEEGLTDLLNSLDKGEEFEPSAKMLKMISFIQEWHATAPNDKIICYSQWTSMIDLVQTLLARDGIKTTRFDGRMSRVSRDDALARFKRHGGPSIMLISLKCGGVGLNLVEANRVLCLDLAWNAATENQAFDRVHRLGQQKDVHVKRLVVRNTVEERMLNLQAKKQALADAALGEGKAQKIKKMSVKELKALFGM